MKISKRILFIALCLVLVTGVFAACSGGGDKSKNKSSTGTILIGTTAFNGVFNYLFYNSAYDFHVVELASLPAYRMVEGGELKDGACTYQEPEVKKDGDKEYTVYTFKIRDGVKFSDGEPMTADDLIFTWKCEASPAYEGLMALYSYNIRGINEYRYDDPNYAAKLEKIKAEAAKPSKSEVREAAAAMADSDYSDDGYGPEGLIEDLDLKIDPSLKPGSDEYKNAVIDAATDVYFKDYHDDFVAEAAAAKEQRLVNEYVTANMQGGEKVPDISGIKKIDDKTVEVTADGVDPTLIYQLCDVVVPEHYYGEGITKVDFSKMKEKNDKPLGAGPYVFEKFENDIVTLKANPNYIDGAPKTETLKLQAIPNSDQLSVAINGDVNIMDDVVCNPDNVKSLEDAGKYCMTWDRNGWGYVGISAKKLPNKDLRKGLMHLMNRDLGVKTYYGDKATVLERPLTMASWGYPVNDNAPVYDYNVDKAKEYFTKAGYTEKKGKLVDKNGKVLHIDAYISDTDHPVVPLFNQMKVDMEKMGAEFNIQQLDWASYNEMYSKGDLALWAAAYGDGSPDPDPYQYFHSDAIAAGNNPFFLKDAKVDELIMQGRSILDRDKRMPIYEELFNTIMDTATVMPYYQRLEMASVDPTKVDVDSLNQKPDAFYALYPTLNKVQVAK